MGAPQDDSPRQDTSGSPPGRSALPAASLAALRGPAVRRLLELSQDGGLSRAQVGVVASALAVSERTVWRWLAAARSDPRAAAAPGSRDQGSARFTVTPEVRRLLALWKGNVAAVHRELVARAAAASAGPSPRDGAADPAASAVSVEPGESATHDPGSDVDPAQGPVSTPTDQAATGSEAPLQQTQHAGAVVPSLMTLRRAIRRDLTPGERAGLAAGERAARKHDVFLARPRGWRNQVWETDHVQAPVRVDVHGQPDRPWITWFIDCATKAITGAVVTAGYPSRESVLAALRSAVLRTDPYGPLGGLPEKVRMDRGRDFLSRAVQDAFTVLKVEVEDLPAYTPHLKGTVEGLNRSVERMFLASLPGYVHQPRPGKRPGEPKDEALLSFPEFTDRFLAWVSWWNTEHRPGSLRGSTPLQAWQRDPTPLREVPPQDLWTFTLEDAGTRKLTTRGVRFKNRDYMAAWMTGNAGITVRVRYMPHHDHEVEVFDAVTGRHLGPAHLADQATEEQVKAVRRARQARTRRLAKDLQDSQEQERYAASAQPEAPRRLGALTAAQADHELARSDLTDLSALALPDLLPLTAPPPGLPVPPSVAARVAAAQTEPPVAPGPARTAADHTPAEEDR